MELGDHLKEQLRGILKVIVVPITNTNGSPIYTLNGVLKCCYQHNEIPVEWKMSNPDKPGQDMDVKKMPDVLSIVYDR